MPDDTPAPVAPARPLVDVPPTPIKVDPSAFAMSAWMAARQIALVVGGGIAITGYVHSHDWTGLATYIEGDGAMAACVAIGTIAVFVYGQWKGWRDRRNAVRMARNVDDRIAVVKTEGAPS